MSHAKEIREKKALQAKLQLSTANTSRLVSSWLKTSPSATTTTTTNSSTAIEDASARDFFALPIIGGSSGLSLLSSSHLGESDKSISTIGDYVLTGKSLTSLGSKKAGLDNKKVLKNTLRPSSKALSALQNKLRAHGRQQNPQNAAPGTLRSRHQHQQRKVNVESDSDDDDDDRFIKSAPKKSFGLLIDSKIKKK